MKKVDNKRITRHIGLSYAYTYIRQCIVSGSWFLNLNNLLLEELPEIISECKTVKCLFLGSYYYDGSIYDIKYDEKNDEYSNNFTEIPKQIGKLTGLEVLYIDNNKIENLSGIEELKNLKRLNASSNRISNVKELQSLSFLSSLNLNNNKISHVRDVISISSLKHLSLNNNSIASVQGISSITNLAKLELAYNNIENFIDFADENGEFPKALISITGNKLNISHDYITFSHSVLSAQITKCLQNYLILKKRIGENKKTKKPYLNLNNMSLTGLPIELGELKHLKQLFIGSCYFNEETCSIENAYSKNRNRMASIPRIIGELANLEVLYVDNNQITSVDLVGYGSNIVELNLNFNKINKIKLVGNFKKLKRLYFCNNKIDSLGWLESVSDVEVVDISENLIEDVEIVGKLKKLKSIKISCNKLKNVTIDGVDSCKSIELMDCNIQNLSVCSSAMLKVIRLEFSEVRNLMLVDLEEITDLNLVNIGLRRIHLENLPGLKTLNISENYISSVENLIDLPRLASLNARDNRLSSISNFFKFIGESNNLKKLYLAGNRIRDIEPSLIAEWNCINTLSSYVAALSKGEESNTAAKLIVIGNTTAGKTSLCNFLVDGTYRPGQASTHGINNLELVIDDVVDGEDLNVSIWDFGGQEYYHATHHLFMSNNAVYVLVWEKDTNTNGFIDGEISLSGSNEKTVISIEHFHYEYWLDRARTYAPGSPIILSQNKIDIQNVEPIPESTCLEYQLNTSHILPISIQGVSCGNENYVIKYEDFKYNLLSLLKKSATKFRIGKYWLLVKKSIIEMRKNLSFITYDEFCKKCLKIDSTMDQLEIETLAKYLHETGVILHYVNTESLRSVVFTDPVWVCKIIYEILNRDVLDNEGEFTIKDVRKSVTGHSLSSQLVGLMLNFELVFKAPYDSHTYIAPQYLSESYEIYSPMYRNAISNHISELTTIAFVLKFKKFLAKSIVVKFMSQYGKYVEAPTFWKHGIIFRVENVNVYVKFLFLERKVLVFSNNVGSRSRVVGKVYEYFKELSVNNRNLYVSVNNLDFVNTVQLQKDVESGYKEMRSEDNQICSVEDFKHLFDRNLSSDVEVFVSYAKTDKDFFDVFYNKFTEIAEYSEGFEFNIWCDRGIDAGSNWHQQIQENLHKCRVAIFLVSNSFMASDYIKNEEFNRFIARMRNDRCFFIPISFVPCRYTQWPELTQKQFYKPDGGKYGKSEVENFTFSHLVEFDNNRKPKPNPFIDQYIIDLIDNIETLLSKVH